MPILKKIFGDPNEKEIKKIQPVVEKVNSLEESVSKLSDAKIKTRIQEIREKITKKIEKEIPEDTEKKTANKKINDILEPHLPEVFALVREVSKRRLKMRHFDVQLIGGYVLHSGKISEMKTGEGKTLVATLAATLNALTGLGVHVVTVNDYLSKRDAGWMGAVYNGLGLSVGVIIHDEAFLYDEKFEDENALDEKTKHMRPVTRKEAYAADITYGTNNEFGFDYLRDNMVQSLDQMVQRGLNFAVVDEVDSILIDEARTPLIISAPAEESTGKYYQFAELAEKLKKDKDYVIDEKQKAVSLTDEGIAEMERMLGMNNVYEEGGIETVHHIEQSLKAVALFKKDRDYVVKDGEVIIVDEFTGRLMLGRRYSEGLHQAIEAKESVEIKRESLTLATISFQNYFRLYTKLSGMTGTAETEAEEFHKIYSLDVLIIPTNMPNVRKDLNDVIYKTELAKFRAIVQDVKERSEKGQPVLIGTVSIERNELLSDMLKRNGVKHSVLNAKFHEKEALIISQAGQKGTVTVATNMAGRGTDIVLGDGVTKFGGLHVIGSERHEARRIDNQLRGRCGRQGDPGSTQFYVSLEDDLMRIFGSERIGSVMQKLGLPDDQPIQHGMISKSLESAQRKVEGNNFDIRKHLVEYDDVMNKQREYVYGKRRMILGDHDVKTEILDYLSQSAEFLVTENVNAQTEEFDYDNFIKTFDAIVPTDNKFKDNIKKETPEEIIGVAVKYMEKQYEAREKEFTPEIMRSIERSVYLHIIDTLWIDHLDAIDRLREGIGLRAYGQMEPLVEYKKESYGMFQQFLAGIRSEIVNMIFKIRIQPAEAPREQESRLTKAAENAVESGAPEKSQNASIMRRESGSQAEKNQTVLKKTKVGRNDPCPCGSGKKYKKCCGKNS
ncbi:MAG: preprotein translocase subunit SecA [bacterium]|nr:preprotein translocase subunit SecA [bacterium]